MKRVRNLLLYPLTALSLLTGLSSCVFEGDEGGDGSYTIPADYSSFEGVDFSGQTARLDMIGEIGAYAKSAHTPGTKLDAAKLKAMFANEGNPFSKEGLNASGKKLKDKTSAGDLDYFAGLFDSAAAASQDAGTGSQGKAGLVTAANGSRYLMDGKGREYAQLIEKGLMGAVAYYQATQIYLDPETKLSETHTDSARAHHWDEAYGYFTGNLKFPSEDKDKERFWSKYAGEKADKHFGTNARIARAFARGRAAIVHKDRKTMLDAVDSVRFEWERVSAASAVSYLNAAKKSLADDGARNHQLTEAIAFVRALKYNPARKITLDQIAEVEAHVGEDFYEVTVGGIDKAIDLLSSIYGFDAVKANL
jgi:hypothetical protein